MDVINISAGFDDDDDEVTEAVKQAALANPEILIFAAAANWGNTKSVAFPARLTDKVFCIFSYNPALRVLMDTNPNPVGNGPNFALLGQDVAPNPSSFGRKSGTSIASALAAGLAGRILDFVRQDDVTRKMPDRVRKKVGTKEGMTNVFREMSRRDGPSFWCVAPWELLPEGVSQRSRQETRDEIRVTIERSFWRKGA